MSARLCRRTLESHCEKNWRFSDLSIEAVPLFRSSYGCGYVVPREVSYFAYIGWKLETSGNEIGNFVFFETKNGAFIGKSEGIRKLGVLGIRKLRGNFWPSEVSIVN